MPIWYNILNNTFWHQFIRTWKFIRARHRSLSWAWYMQFPPSHPIPLKYILILSSHLRLGRPNGLFSSGFPTKILHAFLIFPIRATCSAHLILLDLVTLTFGEAYKLWSLELSLPDGDLNIHTHFARQIFSCFTIHKQSTKCYIFFKDVPPTEFKNLRVWSDVSVNPTWKIKRLTLRTC
jgi:hypothetical protein